MCVVGLRLCYFVGVVVVVVVVIIVLGVLGNGSRSYCLLAGCSSERHHLTARDLAAAATAAVLQMQMAKYLFVISFVLPVMAIRACSGVPLLPSVCVSF